VGDRCVARRATGDRGSAMVEFLGMSLLLLVPLIYLVVALCRIQAGVYSAELAARDAARGGVVAGVGSLDSGASRVAALDAASRRANSAVALTLDDFGFDADRDATIALTCVPPPCFEPGSDLHARVDVEVAFPGLPGFVRAWLPLSVTVSGEASSPVDGFASGK